MEKRKPFKSRKIVVEGNDTATRSDGEGSEIGVGPEAVWKIVFQGQSQEGRLDGEGFRLGKEAAVRQRPESSVNVPRLAGREGLFQRVGMRGEAKEPQHRDPAEGEVTIRIFTPIHHRRSVMDVAFVHQGKPDVDIRQIKRQ